MFWDDRSAKRTRCGLSRNLSIAVRANSNFINSQYVVCTTGLVAALAWFLFQTPDSYGIPSAPTLFWVFSDALPPILEALMPRG